MSLCSQEMMWWYIWVKYYRVCKLLYNGSLKVIYIHIYLCVCVCMKIARTCGRMLINIGEGYNSVILFFQLFYGVEFFKTKKKMWKISMHCDLILSFKIWEVPFPLWFYFTYGETEVQGSLVNCLKYALSTKATRILLTDSSEKWKLQNILGFYRRYEPTYSDTDLRNDVERV